MHGRNSIWYPFYELQVSLSHPSGNESIPYAHIGRSWFIIANSGNQVIWHNGGIVGYSPFVGFNQFKQIGLAILSSCYFIDVPPIEMLKIAIPFLLYHPN